MTTIYEQSYPAAVEADARDDAQARRQRAAARRLKAASVAPAPSFSERITARQGGWHDLEGDPSPRD